MKILSVLFFVVLFFSSCHKKNEGPNQEAQLMSDPWIIQSIEVSPALPLIGTDYFSAFDDCSKDDQLVFLAGKKYERREGAMRCSSTGSDILESGTWQLSEDRSKITFTSDQNVIQEFELISLSGETLVVNYVSNFKTTYNYKTTYVHP